MRCTSAETDINFLLEHLDDVESSPTHSARTPQLGQCRQHASKKHASMKGQNHRSYHRCLLKHVKVLRTVPTDAYNLCSKSFKLLLVLTKLRSLNCAPRSASLCELTMSAHTGLQLDACLFCMQQGHPNFVVSMATLLVCGKQQLMFLVNSEARCVQRCGQYRQYCV